MPYDIGVDSGVFQSCQDGLSFNGRPCGGCLRTVPHQWEVQGNAHGLLFLPPDEFCRDGQPESRATGTAARLLNLPLNDELAECEL